MKKELSTSLKWFYGIGDLGFTLMSNVETFYFNFFLTNIAQFSVGVTGLIGSIASIVDACLSWAYGLILNTIKPKKWGRYRSWLVLTPWLVPFLYAFQFTKIGSETTAAIIITAAAIISHIVWNFGYVANVSMIAAGGHTPEARASLAATRGAYNNIGGLLFSYLGLPLATVLGGVVGEMNQFAALSFIFGVLTALGYFAHFKMFEGYEAVEEVVEKKADAPKEAKVPILKALNGPLVALMIADLAKWMIKFVVAAVAVYYFTYVAGNVALQATYLLASNIAGILGAYIAKYIANAMSTRTATIATYLVMAVLLFVGYFLRNNSTIVIAIMSVVQFGYGVVYSCTPALYADATIYSEWKIGRNPTGLIMGLQNVPLKVAVVSRSVVVATCLAIANFDASIDPSQATDALKSGVSVGFMVIPACALVVGALFLIFGFKITKEKVNEMQAEIDARKAA